MKHSKNKRVNKAGRKAFCKTVFPENVCKKKCNTFNAEHVSEPCKYRNCFLIGEWFRGVRHGFGIVSGSSWFTWNDDVVKKAKSLNYIYPHLFMPA